MEWPTEEESRIIAIDLNDRNGTIINFCANTRTRKVVSAWYTTESPSKEIYTLNGADLYRLLMADFCLSNRNWSWKGREVK